MSIIRLTRVDYSLFRLCIDLKGLVLMILLFF